MYERGFTVQGQGPIIVFLHSSLSSSNQWKNLVKKLGENHTCINIDLYGYGKADSVLNPEKYNFSVEVERINAIINQVGLGEKYHLVGHSCGGAIALKMAVETPSRLLSLSLFEPVAFHLLENVSSQVINNTQNNLLLSVEAKAEKTTKQVKAFAHKIAGLDKGLATQTFVDFWNGKGFYQALPEKFRQAMANDIEKVNLDFKGIFHETYHLNDLSQVKCPCLVMYGNYSPDISQFLSQCIAEQLMNVQIKVVNAGHMAPISHPDLVECITVDFIQT